MNRKELKALNAELIDLLLTVREQIDDKLDELGAVEDEEAEDAEDEDDEDEDDEDAVD